MFSKIRTAVQTATTLNNAAENVTEEIAAVKAHLEEHKEAYLAGASCLTVGVGVGAALFGRRQIVDTINKQRVVIRPIQIGIHNTIGNINTIVTPAGHRGDMLQIAETGEILASRTAAAARFATNRTKIARHLSGAVDNIDGYHLVNLGESLAPRI